MATEGEMDADLADTCLVDVSRTRLAVLKALQDERRTVSELARDLDATKSTVHGYLEDLVADGFVTRHEDEDRLWVYYSLTDRGEALVSRDRLTLVVDISTLAAFLTAAGLGLYRFLTPSGGTPSSGTLSQGPEAGTPWLMVGYVTAIALVLAGVGLHVYLRRRPVDVEPV